MNKQQVIQLRQDIVREAVLQDLTPQEEANVLETCLRHYDPNHEKAHHYAKAVVLRVLSDRKVAV